MTEIKIGSQGGNMIKIGGEWKTIGPNDITEIGVDGAILRPMTADEIATRDKNTADNLKRAQEALARDTQYKTYLEGVAQIIKYLTGKYGSYEEAVKDPAKKAQLQAEEKVLVARLEDDIRNGRTFSIGGSLSPVFLIGALILFMWISK